MRRFVVFAGIAAAVTACDTSRSPVEPRAMSTAPRFAAVAAQPELIAGQYIVVFKQDVQDPDALAQSLIRAHGATHRFSYTHAIKGFAAKMSDAAAAAIARNPQVAYVEQDQVMRAITTETNATWGIDRIDQRALPLSGTYSYTPTGAGVTAYIIDTGIRFDHVEFGGRAATGVDEVTAGGNASDCNGHGTHVSGTVGGATYGVAKGVRLVAVRVLDCSGSGTTSGVVAGIDWVTGNHATPAVANMSLGGGASTSLDDAVRRSISAGVTYAIAAGNSNADACSYSPARVAEAITVGATTSSDARASYSNFGSCLDLFAPGSSITSAWYTSTTATNTISGTSMATPHVTGTAALFLETNPSAAPATVAAAITSSATTGVVTTAGAGSPNRLLYSPLTPSSGGGGGGGTGGAPCTSCTAYTGSLATAGSYQYQPNGNYYYTPVSGTHHGWLSGPSGADFDLYLYKWNGFGWALVGRSDGSTATEEIAFSGTAGYYLWNVSDYSGSGTYTLWLQTP
jgi:subtilisin family serine protease